MLTRTWCFLCAGLVLAQVLFLRALPFPLAGPEPIVWQLLAFASITVLLWVATDGTWPAAVTGASAVLALLTFPAGAVAAVAAGVLMHWKTGAKTSCVESSAP